MNFTLNQNTTLYFLLIPLLVGCGPSESDIAKREAEELAKIQKKNEQLESEYKALIDSLSALNNEEFSEILSKCRLRAESDIVKKNNYATLIDKDSSPDKYIYLSEKAALEPDKVRIKNFRTRLENIENDPDRTPLMYWLKDSLNTVYAFINSSDYGKTVEHRRCYLENTNQGIDIRHTVKERERLVK